MSIKRQAPSELNHDNWNEDEPADDKEMGQFKAAPKDVLEKRVIRTAKRKNPVASEAGKSVFSGFGGFNKAMPSSFEFLANLTNGSKSTNGSTGTGSSETTATPGLFTNKPAATGSSLFGVHTSPSAAQPTTLTSPFGMSSKSISSSTLFTAAKADASKETPFKINTVTSSTQINSTKPTPQAAPSVFGVSSTSAGNNKPLFSSTNSTPFKMQPASSTTTTMVQTSFGITTPAVTSVTPEKKTEDDSEKSNEKKIKYFSKLKGLNESVSDWINKHVAQTPLCILSPIFKDYEKYLKEITEEYQSIDKEPGNNMDVEKPAAKTENVQNTKTSSPFAINNTGSSPFTRNSSGETSKTSLPFGTKKPDASPSKVSTSIQDAKTSTPFGLSNNASSPLLSRDTKTPSPFAINNTGSSPLTSSSAKAPTTFGTNNTGSSPLNNQDTKASSLFANSNTGSSQVTSPKASTPFGTNNAVSSPLNSKDTNASSLFANSNTGSSQLTSPKPSMPFGTNNPGSSPLNTQDAKTSTPFGVNNNGSSPFNSSSSSATPKPSLFSAQSNLASSPENKQPSFSFGVKASPTNASSTSTPSTGFSFSVTSSATTATNSPFSLATNTSTNQTITAPFSFGNGKPFSFGPNTVQQPSSEPKVTENEEDEPPKEYTTEYTPLKEENSVYEKKCKIFVKKDGNFADKGVGTLYIKKIEGNVKHQLLVRANTNLGTVLLNLVLAEAIPSQRMGKNNVMLVCIPTPDAKPPPTPVLIRVKTGEEADELLQTLKKYKA